MRADKIVVLAAVRRDGLLLQHAADHLKRDKDVVLSATHQNGLALKFVPNDVGTFGMALGLEVSTVARGGCKYKFCGICSHQGKVYAAPFDADKLLVYDPSTGALEGIDVSTVARGDSKFQGICSHQGKLYAAPSYADKLLVYGPSGNASGTENLQSR